jgi:type II secretory pathway component PulJ
MRLRGGFTMTEMLGALIMLAVVSLFAARLFRSSMRVVADAPAAQNSMTASEAMLRQLRADCWNAAEVRAPANDRAEIRLGDGKSVRWQIADESVTRTSGEAVAGWPNSAAAGKMHFGVEGQVLIVASDQTRIHLPSELAVLNRGRSQ